MASLYPAIRGLALELSNGHLVTQVRNHWPARNPRSWSGVARRINDVLAGYGGVESQPLLIADSLQRLGMLEPLLAESEGPRFVDASLAVGRGLSSLVEWLRSRLPGYPRLLVPHVERNGPFHIDNFIPGHRLPWSRDVRGLGLQQRGEPPDVRRLFGLSELSCLSEHVSAFSEAVQGSEAWVRFRHCRAGLRQEVVSELTAARDAYRARAADSVVDEEAGSRMLRQASYRWHVLDDISQGLSSEALSYWSHFVDLDALLEDLWHLTTHVALFRAPLQIADVTALTRVKPGIFDVCVDGDPFDFRMGMAVFVPAGASPMPICGIVTGRSLTFGATTKSCLTIKALPGGWESLLP